RRLSEYGVDNSKVYKLLVSRDRSCDESLMQMTWPETDPHPDAHNAADAPGLSAADKNGTLPCYRTTADDYRKAIARSEHATLHPWRPGPSPRLRMLCKAVNAACSLRSLCP